MSGAYRTAALPVRDWAAPLVLFSLAIVTLALLWHESGPSLPGPLWLAGWGLFTLFAISCGFSQPGVGHVSFDRIAQFSALFILGPFAAALINLCVSFIYPWHRLWRAEPWRRVLAAALGNAGMMVVVILVGGWAYIALGGTLPLTDLSPRTMGAILGAGAVVHLTNEWLMWIVLRLRGEAPCELFDRFTAMVEGFSYLVGALVALLWAQLSPAAFTLLLTIMIMTLLMLRQLGVLRVQLGALVEARTADLRRKSEELERLSRTDELTGLPNRRSVEITLRTSLAEVRRLGAPLAIALADLDHFKTINDDYSHVVGDKVLRRVADILARRTPSPFLAARLGGEEFFFCFPGVPAEVAAQHCEQLRLAIADLDLGDLAVSRNLTLSFGVAALDGHTVDSLLESADRALYAAKDAGRNCVITA